MKMMTYERKFFQDFEVLSSNSGLCRLFLAERHTVFLIVTNPVPDSLPKKWPSTELDAFSLFCSCFDENVGLIALFDRVSGICTFFYCMAKQSEPRRVVL